MYSRNIRYWDNSGVPDLYKLEELIIGLLDNSSTTLGECTQIREFVSELRGHGEALREQYAEEREKVSTLEDKVSDLEYEISNLKEEIISLERELNDLNQQ